MRRRNAEARAATLAAAHRAAALDGIWAAALASPLHVSFGSLRRRATAAPFDANGLDVPLPEPRAEDYQPGAANLPNGCPASAPPGNGLGPRRTRRTGRRWPTTGRPSSTGYAGCRWRGWSTSAARRPRAARRRRAQRRHRPVAGRLPRAEARRRGGVRADRAVDPVVAGRRGAALAAAVPAGLLPDRRRVRAARVRTSCPRCAATGTSRRPTRSAASSCRPPRCASGTTALVGQIALTAVFDLFSGLAPDVADVVQLSGRAPAAGRVW